ncbi:MAG: PKD domain-containing protein [Woeseiaceae bacterium]
MKTLTRITLITVLVALTACIDGGNDVPTERVCAIMRPCSNSKITVFAGQDQRVVAGDTVELRGGANAWSSKGLTYQWTQTSGPVVNVIDATQPSASFIAPSVNALVELEFKLTLRKSGKKTSDKVKIVVEPASMAAQYRDTEVEPNDSPQAANTLILATHLTEIYASISSANGDSNDFFVLAPPASGDYSIVLCVDHSNCIRGTRTSDVYLTVYDQDLNLVADTMPGGLQEQGVIVRLSAGLPYYVAVTGWHGAMQYSLTIVRK